MPIYTDIDELRGEERIDSRDMIELADDLRERDDLTDEERAFIALVDDEAGGVPDFRYGAHFIREDDFIGYARELAEDIGAISGDEGWPLHCIDWEYAARELRMDYTDATILGYDYLVRA